MIINGKTVDENSIVIRGIDYGDHPDYCDAYIDEACFEDGTPLTDDEAAKLDEDNRDWVQERVLQKVSEGE